MAYVVVNKRSFPGKTKSSKNKNYIANGSRIDRDGEHQGYVYTGPAEYLVGHILGQLSSRPKKGHLGIAFTQCRSVKFMTCAMREIYCKLKVASLSLPRNQSDRSANVTNLPVNGKDVK